MKYAQVSVTGGSYLAVCAPSGEWKLSDTPGTLFDLLRSGRDAVMWETDRILRDGRPCEEQPSHADAGFGTPSTIRDFYAFEEHVRAGRRSRALGMDPLWYQQPVFYFSNPYAAVGSGEIPMTPGSYEFDFEMEVAAILWEGGSNIAPEDAESLIAGYCIMNDWSGRDVQRQEMRLSMGPVKGKDTATSLGPLFVTRDELEDLRSGRAFDVNLTVSVNGRVYSQSNLNEIYWSFPEMIAYASRGTQVRPGDVIGSGTANGGCLLELRGRDASEPLPWLAAGDTVEISADRMGTLRNTIVPAAEVFPLRPEL